MSECIKKLKVVWADRRGNWHHDFEITGGDPVAADGTLIAHVTKESMKALLDADRTEDL